MMNKKILFLSLGCDKNLVDSEKMLGLLADAGYEFTDDEAEAEVAIINTCSFISDAKEESIQEIIRLAELKKTGKLECLLITGCLSERYREQIAVELPEVDGLLGISSWDKIPELVASALEKRRLELFDDKNNNVRPSIECKSKRIITTSHYAYLKIAEGCNKRCTYCSIPYIRGSYHSVPMELLVDEAKDLADRGVKELILVAQETTVYGLDLYGEKTLHKLIRSLSEIEGIEFIRLFYCYPEEITDELVEEMKVNEKVCHYMDIPIQHSEDSILKAMGRRTTKNELIERIQYLRKEIPDIALRTTLIAGFPGETEESHQAVLEFIDEMEFQHLGAFAYSPEEGTKAAEMDNQVDEAVKKQYVDEIMELQQEICLDINERQVGRRLKVIVEGRLPEEHTYLGRSYMDAPNIDSYIFFESDYNLMSGDIVYVNVTGASDYDLIGELEDELAE